MLVYIDNCCFNRPYDDQSIIINRLEAQAVLYIQNLIKNSQIFLVWSYMLDYENSFNPFENRRYFIEKWREEAKKDVDENSVIVKTANELMNLKIKKKDALHIACALFAKCDYFITTDKKLLSKRVKNIILINPLHFLEIKEF